jgi:hypothetical protein
MARLNGMILVVSLFAFSSFAKAEVVNFDKAQSGVLPAGWKAGSTSGGSPKWSVEDDSSAPSTPHVLKQSGEASFPWCVKEGTSLEDGFVEVKFKALAGNQDQAGGIIWRWKSGDSYYVARGNALENNVSLYYVENGKRKTIKYVDASVPPNKWNTLRAEFSKKAIKILLNGKKYIDLEDDRISGPGAVGVWTKADSVTAFDDFSFGSK